jgi:hypothetical protein
VSWLGGVWLVGCWFHSLEDRGADFLDGCVEFGDDIVQSSGRALVELVGAEDGCEVQPGREEMTDDAVVHDCSDAFVLVGDGGRSCAVFMGALFAQVSDDDDDRDAVVCGDWTEADFDRELGTVRVTAEEVEPDADRSWCRSGDIGVAVCLMISCLVSPSAVRRAM